MRPYQPTKLFLLLSRAFLRAAFLMQRSGLFGVDAVLGTAKFAAKMRRKAERRWLAELWRRHRL